MTEKCSICGRTKEDLKDELNLDAEIVSHQEVDKCEKCVSEYKMASSDIDTESVIPEDADMTEKETDWKDQATA